MRASLRKHNRLAGHRRRVFDVSWSPTQPACMASVGQTCGLIFPDIDDAQTTKPVPLEGEELMRVCWTSNGTHALTGSADGKICVRAASDGALSATLEASAAGDEVYGLKMLDGEDGLLAVGAGPSVQQWDLSRGWCTAHTKIDAAEDGVVFGGVERNPEKAAFVCALATRGRALSAALSDGTVRLFDSQTLKELGSLDEHARRGAPAFSTAMSPTRPLMATSDSQGAIALWDMRQLRSGPLALANARGGAVHALAFVLSADGSSELLVSGGSGRQLRVHDTNRQLATQCVAEMASPVLCIEPLPHARTATTPHFATGGGTGELFCDSGISLWRVAEGSDGTELGEASAGRDREAATSRSEKRLRDHGQAETGEEGHAQYVGEDAVDGGEGEGED